MNIIQIKSSLLPVWWMAWLGILLIAFGIPSLIARMTSLPVEASHLALLDGQKIAPEQIDALDFSRRRVGNWFPVNEFYSDVVLVALERAVRMPDNAKAFYGEAEIWQRKALTVTPSDAYGWYRLAYLFYMIDGPSQRIAAAWRQSLASAPYEPRLALPQLQMAMSLGSLLGEESRLSIERLARDAWHEDKGVLVRLADEGHFISVVESALSDDAAALKDFHDRLHDRQ